MTAKQIIFPANRAFNSDGAPEAGATAYLYLSGGTTPATFYADAGLTVSLGHQITANAAGRFVPHPYQESTTPFRLIIEDAEGAVLDDIDPFYFGYQNGATGPQGTPGPAGDIAKVADRTELAAIVGQVDGATRFLTETGREGIFVWSSANNASNVTGDPRQGIYVAPASDVTGASGAWIRKPVNTGLNASWFGALGDGSTDDSAALAAASAYINAAGGGTLNLTPNATYIIGGQALSLGHQSSGYSYPPNVTYPIEFNACTKPVILRGNGATIKCKTGAKFGTFNDDGTSKGTTVPYIGGGLATPYNAMIYAHSCTAPVHIENVTLDGNLAGLTIGGQYGDSGWQIPCTGLQTSNNTDIVSVEDVVSHHHALDGAQIDGPSTADTALKQQGIVTGLKTYCNGRQGLSFVGGKGWSFRNCSFNWTGKANPGSDTAAAIQSGPGAGVDLEAEGGKVIRDLNFDDCEFIGNYGQGMVSDNTDVDRVKFSRCTFIGTTNYSMWAQSPRFVFEDCRIMGCMVDLYGNADPNLATKFKRCHFLWAPTQSPTGVLYASGGNPLVVAKFHDPGSSGANIRAEECVLEWNAPADGVGSQTTFGWWHNCTIKASVSGYIQAFGSFSGRNTTFTNCASIPRQDLATAMSKNYAGASYDFFTSDGTLYAPDADIKTVGGIVSVNGVTVFNSSGVLQAGGFPVLTGDVTTPGASLATTIAAGAVSLAKMANVATSTVFYRKTAGAGAPEVQTLATLKTDLGLTGTNSGDQTSIVGITGTIAQFNTAITDADIVPTGLATASGLTMSTGKLLGRSTAATGAIEELGTVPAVNFPALTGDVTTAGGALATTVANNAITYAKFQQIAASSLVGNATGSLANATGITLGSTLAFSGSALQTAAITGDVTASANSFATTLATNVVTYAKFQQVAASSLVGNATGSLANATGITLAGGLAFSGSTLTAAGALTPTSVASTGAITSSSASAASGYATGAGGAVTQLTSRTTGVTLSKPCGAITLFSAAGSATWATFTVTNTLVAATDTIEICQKSGANLYNVIVTAVGSGSFNVSVSAVSGTATEAPVFNFIVIKAVTA